METLGRILNEITQSNQLQLGSYWDVVDARKKIEKSIRQSQVEYKEKEAMEEPCTYPKPAG